MKKNKTTYRPLLSESVILNSCLIKTPVQTQDLPITLTYNVWEIYKKALLGQSVPLAIGSHHHVVDRTTETWDSWYEWCEKMVWYGNRRGAYLYGNKPAGTEIAGHH